MLIDKRYIPAWHVKLKTENRLASALRVLLPVTKIANLLNSTQNGIFAVTVEQKNFSGHVNLDKRFWRKMKKIYTDKILMVNIVRVGDHILIQTARQN